MKLNNWHKGIILTLSAHVIWGIAGPFVKVVLTDIPPMSLMFLRALFTTLILFPIFEFKLLPELKEKLQKENKLPKKNLITDIFPFGNMDIKDIFLCAFFGVFLNLALYFWGQTRTTVIDAWVIASTGTIFLVIYSYFFLKERLDKKVYVGVGIAFLGTLVIIGSPIFSFGQGDFFGNFLMLGSAIAAVISFVILKRLVAKYSPVLIAFYTFLITLVLSIPLFIWEFIQDPSWMTRITTGDVLIIAYLVIGSSILAYIFSNTGLKFIPASIASTMGYVSTIVAVSLSILFLDEKPTVFFMIGSVLIIIGLAFAETRHQTKKHPNAS